LALAHFRGLGFRALARNEHRRFGEIDLLLYDGQTLVFAEVKTRHIQKGSTGVQDPGRETLGWPSIDQFKRSRKAVNKWLTEQGSDRPRIREMRFDVVKVLLDESDRPVRLDHIKAAWEGAW
jgi:putative endonuclease